MTGIDISHAAAELTERVRSAVDAGTALRIVGGDTKRFYGGEPMGQILKTATLSGIINYDPTELVVHVGAGTPIAELEQTLREAGQSLPFEPPSFGDAATVGGVVAAGLSGPRRPYAGSVRDYVLGVGLVNGHAEHLAFGGQVMKNVAGYDVSRLVTGSLGVLGLITDVSLKVLPLPAYEQSLIFADTSRIEALEMMSQWALTPAPITALAHSDQQLHVRLSGSEKAVLATARKLGGEVDSHGPHFWQNLKDLKLPVMAMDANSAENRINKPSLWRLSVPAAAADINLDGSWVLDWGGAQRWLCGSKSSPDAIRTVAVEAGGHATEFRGAKDRSTVFQPLSPVVEKLHQRLKVAFDPKGVFNPGRLSPQI